MSIGKQPIPQSPIVWAINAGHEAARECDRRLTGSTELPEHVFEALVNL